MSKLNFRKGFFRVWIVISLSWLGFIFIMFIIVNDFFLIPTKSQIDKANDTVLDSYNCIHKNLTNPRLEVILKRVAPDISKDLGAKIQELEIYNHQNIDKDILDRSLTCEMVLQNIPINKLTKDEYSYIKQLQNATGIGDNFHITMRYNTDNPNCYLNDFYLILNFRYSKYPFCLNTRAYEEFSKQLPQIKSERISSLKFFAIIALLPIFSLLILGLIFIWIISGFKSKT